MPSPNLAVTALGCLTLSGPLCIRMLQTICGSFQIIVGTDRNYKSLTSLQDKSTLSESSLNYLVWERRTTSRLIIISDINNKYLIMLYPVKILRASGAVQFCKSPPPPPPKKKKSLIKISTISKYCLYVQSDILKRTTTETLKSNSLQSHKMVAENARTKFRWYYFC